MDALSVVLILIVLNAWMGIISMDQVAHTAWLTANFAIQQLNALNVTNNIN